MSSLLQAITDKPFIRYLRAQPLDGSQAQAHDAQAANATAPDAAAPAAPAPNAQVVPTLNAHLAGIEKTWLAKRARTIARGTGWMSAMRLVSDNSPLLQIPTKAAPLAAGGVAFFCKDGPFGVVGAMIKDTLCQQLEHFSLDTTYATRAARWSARSAASLWFTAFEGLSQDDVRAWRSRPDYEYPADCNPHDLSPKSDPHCPVLAVAQLANKIEPVMGALMIGAAGLGVVYALYRLDLARHRRPVVDIEAGGLREPLLGAAAENGAPAAAENAAPLADAENAAPPAAASTASTPAAPDAPGSAVSEAAPEPSHSEAPAHATQERVARLHANAGDEDNATYHFDRRLLAAEHPELALASMR